MKPTTPIPAGKGYRLLRGNDRIKLGDRPLYVGGEMGSAVNDNEIGMTPAASGYFAVVRRTAKTPSARKGK